MPPVLPKFSVNNLFWHGNKKDVGVCSSAPIPDVRLSHCLFARISNASQPTPSDIIEFGVDINHQDTMIATNSRDIIHPRERFVALPLCKDSNLRDLTSQTGNVQKTSFSIGCPYKRCSQPLDSINVCFDPPCPYRHRPLLASDSLDWLCQRQSYTKISKSFPFLRKTSKKVAELRKKRYICTRKQEDSRIRQSESNDNRTRRHPVELLAGHLLYRQQ